MTTRKKRKNRRKSRRRKMRRRRRRSTKEYKGRAGSSNPTGPNKAVPVATLLL